jgi:hypothetical protein
MLEKSPHTLPRSEYGGARKRLFIGLMLASCAFVGLALFVGWLVPYLGLSAIHPVLPSISITLCILLLLLLAWLCIGLVFHIYTGCHLPGIQRIRGVTIRLMLPLMVLLGRSFGFSREQVRLSFVKVNNELVLASGARCMPDELLLLAPHCIQRSDCPHRLTTDVERCERCGRCPVSGLLKLRDRWGFQLCMATGGTIARRIVVELRPKLIIAVACERDLTSGIQSCYPIPVFGLPNERPCGPCRDTLISLARLEELVRYFIGPRQC